MANIASEEGGSGTGATQPAGPTAGSGVRGGQSPGAYIPTSTFNQLAEAGRKDQEQSYLPTTVSNLVGGVQDYFAEYTNPISRIIDGPTSNPLSGLAKWLVAQAKTNIGPWITGKPPKPSDVVKLGPVDFFTNLLGGAAKYYGDELGLSITSDDIVSAKENALQSLDKYVEANPDSTLGQVLTLPSAGAGVVGAATAAALSPAAAAALIPMAAGAYLFKEKVTGIGEDLIDYYISQTGNGKSQGVVDPKVYDSKPTPETKEPPPAPELDDSDGGGGNPGGGGVDLDHLLGSAALGGAAGIGKAVGDMYARDTFGGGTSVGGAVSTPYDSALAKRKKKRSTTQTKKLSGGGTVLRDIPPKLQKEVKAAEVSASQNTGGEKFDGKSRHPRK